MRKPRDYDAELKALDDKARQLKVRKLQQLGELVVATGDDALPVEQLAGALLLAVGNTNPAAREEQRKRGATFFQGKEPSPAGGNRAGAQAHPRGAAPAAGEDRA